MDRLLQGKKVVHMILAGGNGKRALFRDATSGGAWAHEFESNRMDRLPAKNTDAKTELRWIHTRDFDLLRALYLPAVEDTNLGRRAGRFF
jgi:hypothetical protein